MTVEPLHILDSKSNARIDAGRLLVQNNGSTININTDNATGDAFGRLRVSNPETLFDSKNIFDDPDLASNVENCPLFYDNQETSGGGTSTLYEVNKAQQSISVSETTEGTRVRQTKQRFNYQPGKSLLVFMTFCMGSQDSGITKREGYFDDKNGLFLEDNGSVYRLVQRSYTGGSANDNAVSQSAWNIDKMDGTGDSGINLNFAYTQILAIDFEWLGVGRVRFGFVVDGVLYYCHEFLNTNNMNIVYMQTPNLPLRSEISNDGSGVASTLTQICSTVVSEGGQTKLGSVRYASTAGTEVTCSTENTVYMILAIKLKSQYIGNTIELLNASIQIQSASSKIEWMVILNPTIAGGAITYTNKSQSAIQYAIGATARTVTGGYIVAGGFTESGGVSAGAAGGILTDIKSALKLGSTIAGDTDQFVLCARPVGGSSNVAVEGAITWQELT